MNNFVRLGFFPRSYDLGLLILRVSFGLALCFIHGWVKIANFAQFSAHFPDPLHIGSKVTLLFAILSDVISALLIALGLGTRWAALIIAINTAAAFVLVHKMALSGPRSGELAFLFFFWALAIFFTGPGRYSVDGA